MPSRFRYRPQMHRDRGAHLQHASRASNPSKRLAPRWAPAVLAITLLVIASLGALVWHSDRLGRVDAWAMREIPAHSHGYQGFLVASAISDAVGPLVIALAAAVVLLAWLRPGRRDALLLSLLAPPVTLAAKGLLKEVVARRAPGGATFMYPSGHLAMATAVAVTLLLVIRTGKAGAGIRRGLIVLAVLFVLTVAWARLAETVHSLSDVVGGVATGVAVPFSTALALTAWSLRPRGSQGLPAVGRRGVHEPEGGTHE
jgi:membrane-associated phospholipid phosphatase